MAVGEAGATQGAGAEHIDDGQSTKGAPVAPVVENGPHGDGVKPVEDDAAAKAAAAAKEEPAKAEAPDAPADEEKKDEEDEKVVLKEYSQFEDPSAQAAVDLLKESGVSPAEAQDIFAKAIESGDTRDIDVKALEAKVGKTKALLIMNGVQDYHNRTTTQNTATVSMVHELFGGEQNWGTVREWAQVREKNDPAFKKELDSIRDDINSGGRAAKAAAKDLLALYNGNPNTKGLGTQSAKLVKGDGSATSAAPLSRSDYITELKKAHSSGAPASTIAALDQRRLAGKNAGI